jgi:hypothetical protein
MADETDHDDSTKGSARDGEIDRYRGSLVDFSLTLTKFLLRWRIGAGDHFRWAIWTNLERDHGRMRLIEGHESAFALW